MVAQGLAEFSSGGLKSRGMAWRWGLDIGVLGFWGCGWKSGIMLLRGGGFGTLLVFAEARFRCARLRVLIRKLQGSLRLEVEKGMCVTW